MGGVIVRGGGVIGSYDVGGWRDMALLVLSSSGNFLSLWSTYWTNGIMNENTVRIFTAVEESKADPLMEIIWGHGHPVIKFPRSYSTLFNGPYRPPGRFLTTAR